MLKSKSGDMTPMTRREWPPTLIDFPRMEEAVPKSRTKRELPRMTVGSGGSRYGLGADRGVVPINPAGRVEDVVEMAIGVGGVVFGRFAREVVLYKFVPDHDEAVGGGIGKRAEEDGVDYAENRGVGSDAEG